METKHILYKISSAFLLPAVAAGILYMAELVADLAVGLLFVLVAAPDQVANLLKKNHYSQFFRILMLKFSHLWCLSCL